MERTELIERERMATNYDSWTEYVDPSGYLDRETFDAMPVADKLALIEAVFGASRGAQLLPWLEDVRAGTHPATTWRQAAEDLIDDAELTGTDALIVRRLAAERDV
jgi:hypothetical protein